MSTANKILMGAAGAAGGGPSDDEFNRVSFLSHFDGENNGVNNVFDDGSASNHTITANGDVTQGSFGPFARPDGEWGVDFDGTGDYLTVAASNDFDVSDGDITIEGFFNFTSDAENLALWTLSIDNNDANGIRFQRQTTGFLRFDVRSGNSYVVNVTDTTISIPLNTWHHVAVTRTSGGDWKVYVNGVIAISATESASSPDTSGIPLSIGANYRGFNTFLNGHVSNFRVVKGTLVYTSNNFTPPTGKLTAITNTKLLTCQSNRFVDNSASAHTVTPSGNAAVSAFGPFLTSSVYDAAVNGASAYFDGSGDALRVSDTASLRIGTGQYTIECWFWFDGLTSNSSGIFAKRDSSSDYWRILATSSGVNFRINSDVVSDSTVVNKKCWNHIAITRDSNNDNRIYVNGSLINTISSSVNISNTGTVRLGELEADTGPMTGYICDARIVIGTAVYTGSSLTPPTAPLTAITNTKLLLNMADGQAIDSTAQDNIKLEAGAKLSTAQYKFGTSSILFDAEADNRASFKTKPFGTGDFTIEGFFRKVAEKGDNDAIWDTRGVGQSGLGYFTLVDETTAGQTREIYFYNGATQFRCGSASALSLNTWYHIAVCRSGTSLRVFLDGTQVGSTFSDSTEYINDYFSLGGFGANFSLARGWDGYVDEFRISYMARYTSNFTAPSEPFADKGR